MEKLCGERLLEAWNNLMKSDDNPEKFIAFAFEGRKCVEQGYPIDEVRHWFFKVYPTVFEMIVDKNRNVWPH